MCTDCIALTSICFVPINWSQTANFLSRFVFTNSFGFFIRNFVIELNFQIPTFTLPIRYGCPPVPHWSVTIRAPVVQKVPVKPVVAALCGHASLSILLCFTSHTFFFDGGKKSNHNFPAFFFVGPPSGQDIIE